MKAVNFLEWFKTAQLYGFNNEEKGLTHIGLKQIINFYSRPFLPEMITELFEGWEYYSEHFVRNDWDIYIEKEMNITHWVSIEPDIDYYLPKPITLHDFISDCQRAGIDLTWKEKIVKEYFS